MGRVSGGVYTHRGDLIIMSYTVPCCILVHDLGGNRHLVDLVEFRHLSEVRSCDSCVCTLYVCTSSSVYRQKFSLEHTVCRAPGVSRTSVRKAYTKGPREKDRCSRLVRCATKGVKEGHTQHAYVSLHQQPIMWTSASHSARSVWCGDSLETTI